MVIVDGRENALDAQLEVWVDSVWAGTRAENTISTTMGWQSSEFHTS